MAGDRDAVLAELELLRVQRRNAESHAVAARRRELECLRRARAAGVSLERLGGVLGVSRQRVWAMLRAGSGSS